MSVISRINKLKVKHKLNYCPWCEMEQRFNNILMIIFQNKYLFLRNYKQVIETPISNISANTNTKSSSTNYSKGHSTSYWIVRAIAPIVIIAIIAFAWEDLLYIGGIIIFYILACVILGG